MKDNIKKLVIREFEMDEEKAITFKKGHKYTHFFDPETGKFYEPNKDFVVSGESLEKMFHEIKTK